MTISDERSGLVAMRAIRAAAQGILFGMPGRITAADWLTSMSRADRCSAANVAAETRCAPVETECRRWCRAGTSWQFQARFKLTLRIAVRKIWHAYDLRQSGSPELTGRSTTDHEVRCRIPCRELNPVRRRVPIHRRGPLTGRGQPER